MADFEVREIKESEFSAWDKFVEESKQGTLFSTSLWMEVLNKHKGGKAKLLGIFSSNELVSGILLYERKKAFFDIMAYPPLTPFTPIIFKETKTPKFSKIESSQKKIINEVNGYLAKNYNFIALQLEPSIKDIRPFLWLGWKSSVSYTYEMDLTNIGDLWEKIDKDAKYEINKAKKSNVEVSDGIDMGKFLVLYEKTFLKQNLKIPLDKYFIEEMFKILSGKNKCKLYYAKTADGEIISGALCVWDNKKSYYLLAANDPKINIGANYLLLWHIIQDMSKRCKVIDLVGANIPDIAKFKREFATNLVPYYIVE
ncbi:GNAT family N-acetyltransferase, partial [Candidatus Woesearchaeota archaeon]|nr:GNAT family N-acetyltransferase [Candidatus Woesearchaeota archaeon]